MSTPLFTESLRSACMLCFLTTNTFGIHRTQRDLSDTIATETNGKANAFAVRKNLLCGADRQQRDLVAAIAAFRTLLYRKSLPFSSSGSMVDRGPRIVANADFFEVQKALAATREQMDTLLNQFAKDYDAAIETAKGNLGSAFDASEYPPFDEVRDAFRIDIEFSPLPAKGGFGASLTESVSMALDEQMEQRQVTKGLAAVGDIQTRARTLVARYRERADAASEHNPNLDGARRPRVANSMFELAGEMAVGIRAFAPLAMLDDKLLPLADALADLATYSIDDLYTRTVSIAQALDKADALLA